MTSSERSSKSSTTDWFSALTDRLSIALTEAFGPDISKQALSAHARHLDRHGDLKRWQAAISELPLVDRRWQIINGCLEAGAEVDQPETLIKQLRTLIPWRKGPLKLGGVHIDTEWRSDLKWNRLAGAIDLRDKQVLDVGAGNGYFGWRMLEAGAARVIACDPTQLFVMQHEAISHFAGPAENYLLALRLEDLPDGMTGFDTVFSMGVLYHRRDHLAHLSDLARRLAQGGELVLETLIIPGEDRNVLVPQGRYANMRNVHALPTVSQLIDWMDAAGYEDIRLIDTTPTTSEEQRSTDWMPFHSLAEALDPVDAASTREGHPAPIRAVLAATIKQSPANWPAQ